MPVRRPNNQSLQKRDVATSIMDSTQITELQNLKHLVICNTEIICHRLLRCIRYSDLHTSCVFVIALVYIVVGMLRLQILG